MSLGVPATIPDSDSAYAYIAGLDDSEQRLVLRALLADMRPASVRDVLAEDGWTHVNPLG